MAEIYFSSDTHFNHDNIRHYCNRPFNSITHMNTVIAYEWNKIVNEDDTIYFLGDFCFEKKGLDTIQDYINFLPGHIVFFKGNHDPSKLKGLDSANIKLGGLNIFMTHIPPENGINLLFFPDLILCGHVHEKWKSKIITIGTISIPMINVGVDQWNFRPVNIKTILKEYRKIKNNGIL